MMMMVIVTMMGRICDDYCDLVMKVILVKEVMPCDVSPVAMFNLSAPSIQILRSEKKIVRADGKMNQKYAK